MQLADNDQDDYDDANDDDDDNDVDNDDDYKEHRSRNNLFSRTFKVVFLSS